MIFLSRHFRPAAARRTFLLAVLLCAASAGAVPPLKGHRFPGKKPTCRVNRAALSERLRVIRAAHAAGVLPPRNSNPAPKVLVVRVDFTGGPALSSTKAEAEALFLDVQDYYKEVSYNTFIPTFTVTNCAGGGGSVCGAQGAYRMPSTMAVYGADCGDDVACHTESLFLDATAAAVADGVDFTTFTHVMVYHAGPGQESQLPEDTDFIWSLYLDQNETVGGQGFVGFTTVPEEEIPGITPHGVICHEYGHQQGLPDLYDTNTFKSTVGGFDLMDYPYGAVAAETPHFGAWSKYFLGFSAPTASTGTVTFAPAETTQGAFVRRPHPRANETFFLEYRDKAAGTFDKGIPGTGLALWRVDEGLADEMGVNMLNNTVNDRAQNGHFGVDLIEADGTQADTDLGDLGNGNLFGNGTLASGGMTESFGGDPSGMTVVVLSGNGTPSLLANIVYFETTPSLAISRLINYPNPGGDRSRYPVRPGAPPATVTTLVVQFSKPLSSSMSLSYDIYDMGGNLVRALPGAAFALKVGDGEPTADNKWVYEYDWDGRTDGGENVASGVYFYRAKVKGEVKTGKLVLIR